MLGDPGLLIVHMRFRKRFRKQISGVVNASDPTEADEAILDGCQKMLESRERSVLTSLVDGCSVGMVGADGLLVHKLTSVGVLTQTTHRLPLRWTACVVPRTTSTPTILIYARLSTIL